MTKLNYDLIPEELKRKAVEALFNCEFSYNGDICTVSKEYVDKIVCSITSQIADTQKTKKPVDMSVLVNSGVLCEFSQNTQFINASKGFLSSIKNERYNLAEWKCCRPLFGHWHSAKNFDDHRTLINNLIIAGFAVEFAFEIECFCITGLQPNYCMPWEV